MRLPSVAQAARNSAVWCDTICRAHGAPGEFHPAHWLNRRPTPRYYPDAQTLCPDADAAPILTLREARGAISVKDSFHRLDLAGHGFTPLFDAEWIAAPAPAPGEPGWTRIDTPSALAEWERGWAGIGGGQRTFLPVLLGDPDLAFIALPGGGGILNRHAGAVGLSNGFGTPAEAIREGLAAAAAALFPGLPLVGYLRAEALAGAQRAGFVAIGALRVWVAP